jgi:hypothetical protein
MGEISWRGRAIVEWRTLQRRIGYVLPRSGAAVRFARMTPARHIEE